MEKELGSIMDQETSMNGGDLARLYAVKSWSSHKYNFIWFLLHITLFLFYYFLSAHSKFKSL